MSRKTSDKFKLLSSVFIPYYAGIVFFLVASAFFNLVDPIIIAIIAIAIGAVPQALSLFFFDTEDLNKIQTKYHIGAYSILSLFALSSLYKIYNWSFPFLPKKKVIPDYNHYG